MKKIISTSKNHKTNSRNIISIVLVEPSKPQNLGSIARLMMNFGFTRLILVNPLLNLADAEIQIVARRANVLINRAQLVYDLNDVRKDFDYIISTTARVGGDQNLKRVAIPPEKLLETEFPWKKIAIVFGREQYGLSNEELELSDLIVTIPTDSAYSAMNLSHATAIILYQLYRKLENFTSNEDIRIPKHQAASFTERKKLINYFEQLITRIGYHKEKKHIAMQAFENILSRGYITGREMTVLMGVFKWINLNLKNER